MADMRLQSKNELTLAELTAIETRLSSIHDLAWHDVAMPNSWARLRPARLFAMFDGDALVGLAAVDGPDDAIDPAWWIDDAYRRKGCGSRLIDQLADRLIADGVTGVRPSIVVAGPNWERSAAMVRKLRRRLVQVTLDW